MPTLSIAHAQYWTRPGSVPANLVARGGYPVWQAAVVATQVVFLILMGF